MRTAHPTALVGAETDSRPTGISFKGQHLQQILKDQPRVGFFEVHPENYFVDGGPRHAALTALREQYPLSLHGVSLSLAGVDPVDDAQLATLKGLIQRYEPRFVSDHLAWSKSAGDYLPDLLPVPLNEETLGYVCDNVNQTQDALGRQIFIENPSSYVAFTQTDMTEADFLQAVVAATGCKLLLDLNNIFVSAKNVGFDPETYVEAIPAAMIGEVHLAGHLRDTAAPEPILIDDHGSRVCDDVWALYEGLSRRVGELPTLVEWDTNVPELGVLLTEAEKANAIRLGQAGQESRGNPASKQVLAASASDHPGDVA